MSLSGVARMEPFLLPICPECAGPMNLSYLEPATDYQPERRTYCCAECGAEEVIAQTCREQLTFRLRLTVPMSFVASQLRGVYWRRFIEENGGAAGFPLTKLTRERRVANHNGRALVCPRPFYRGPRQHPII